MAFRDLIPWSRQENRLPVPVSAERGRDSDTHPLLSLHREMNRLFDDAFRGVFDIQEFAGRRPIAPHLDHVGATIDRIEALLDQCWNDV